MAKTRQQKEAALQILTDHLKESKAVVFSTYQGLTMKDQDELRTRLREAGAKMMVEKKTLMARALDAAKIEVPTELLTGPIAMVFGFEDEVSPAKIIKDFSRAHESIQPLGGVLENRFIELDRVKALAALPSREMMMAKTVGTIKAPITGFVNVLAGNIRGLVYALNAIAAKQSS